MTSVTPTSQHVHVEFDVPQEYVGKDLEVMVQPKTQEHKHAGSIAQFKGSLSEEDYLSLMTNINRNRTQEWNRSF